MSSPLAHHLMTLAINNAWSNHRLLKALLQLSQADFVAPRTSFFPSIAATLNHNLTVDWYYVDTLERGLSDRPWNPDFRGFFDPVHPFADAAPLAEAQRAVDRRLVALTEGLGEADLDRIISLPRRDGPRPENVTRLLTHLFQHQIHHRGQAHAMLAGTHVKPPQLDEFFCTYEAPLRAADLAELGYTEAQIWGRAG